MKARTDGLILVSLGATIVLFFLALVLWVRSQGSALDFIPNYYSARCLMHHCDPYDESKVLQIYRAEDGERALNDTVERAVVTRYIYFPSAFAVMVPLAMFPWSTAYVLWTILSTFSLIVAGYLIWEVGAHNSPILCGALIGYLLANSEILVVLSNPSELAIGLCIIAVWCFIRERYIPAGVLSLAISLSLKPQNAGLICLYFLLAGGAFRKRAVQSLLLAALLSAPYMIWVSAVSPHWIHELRANLLAFSAHGGLNDPGPASKLANELIDMQVIFSRFDDRPAVYNLISILVFLPPFLVWTATTVRSSLSPERTAFALGAIAPLSLLPVYHHFYDSKLILLTLPALAILWKRRDRVSWTAVLLTCGAFFFTGDLSRWLFTHVWEGFHGAPGGPVEWILNSMLVFPPPLILLATGSFYLWIYWQSSRHQHSSAQSLVGSA